MFYLICLPSPGDSVRGVCGSFYPASSAPIPMALRPLVGIILALQMAQEDPFLWGAVEIYTDNQGALQRLLDPGMQSGQFLVRRIVDLIEERRERGGTSTSTVSRPTWGSLATNSRTRWPNAPPGGSREARPTAPRHRRCRTTGPCSRPPMPGSRH
ncbi:hypothetical protein BO85DRAFT_500713 [Aspergillus piperis CBS 112811]|uniref:RNase H type-1 domain-containing protein n=1 Tax=Aspergillus piperis CBS 112811 TaxID=1448313 RepID=A0A8G1VIQ0_9EURO|nr:hypothetical protein BO85DRAFT_500713 [Aspergillus piperis CBS 112811]RAH54576.1 hypothetical protein BO85DRAFT_500713 [Aspergillus piperis CBS 112811]